MLYKVETISDTFISFLDENNLTLELPKSLFDPFISEDTEIEFDIEIPYQVSAQRRADIREHHEDEYRNGNL